MDVDIKSYDKSNSRLGIDLGIKEFCIDSNGVKIENPKYLKKEIKKLVKLQEQFSPKTKNSQNHKKVRIRVARLQEHIANQRKDFFTETVRRYCRTKRYHLLGKLTSAEHDKKS